MAKQSRCEDCMNYVYDEEYDCYTCEQGAELDEDVRYHQFCQYLFFRQWDALKRYCNARGLPCLSVLPSRRERLLSLLQAVRKKGRSPFFFSEWS